MHFTARQQQRIQRFGTREHVFVSVTGAQHIGDAPTARKTSSRQPDISLLMLSSISLPEIFLYSSNTEGKQTQLHQWGSSLKRSHFNHDTSKKMLPVPHTQDGEEFDLVRAPPGFSSLKDLLKSHTHTQTDERVQHETSTRV